jgi:hypothetical protein
LENPQHGQEQRRSQPTPIEEEANEPEGGVTTDGLQRIDGFFFDVRRQNTLEFFDIVTN